MNRCTAYFSPNLLSFAAAGLLLAGVSVFSLNAGAQEALVAQTQNEAAAGGRYFPAGTLRGRMVMGAMPEILLDGKPERLAPGARIYSAQRMLVTPSAIAGQELVINYRREGTGQIREIWILTPQEAQTKRASVQKPLLDSQPSTTTSTWTDSGDPQQSGQ